MAFSLSQWTKIFGSSHVGGWRRVCCQRKRQIHALPFQGRTQHSGQAWHSYDPLASWFSSLCQQIPKHLLLIIFFPPVVPGRAELAPKGIRWALVSATGAHRSIHAGLGGTPRSLSAGAGAWMGPAVSSDSAYHCSHVAEGKAIWRSWYGISSARNVWDVPIPPAGFVEWH